MKFLASLEKNKIATKETLQIFSVSVFFYYLSWVLFKHHFSWWAWCFLLITFGGLGNYYVIYFNDFRMPVLRMSRRALKKYRKENPSRGVCRLDKKTKLAWLADIFEIGKYFYSLGDIFIAVGLFFAILPFGIGVLFLI